MNAMREWMKWCHCGTWNIGFWMEWNDGKDDSIMARRLASPQNNLKCSLGIGEKMMNGWGNARKHQWMGWMAVNISLFVRLIVSFSFAITLYTDLILWFFAHTIFKLSDDFRTLNSIVFVFIILKQSIDFIIKITHYHHIPLIIILSKSSKFVGTVCVYVVTSIL